MSSGKSRKRASAAEKQVGDSYGLYSTEADQMKQAYLNYMNAMQQFQGMQGEFGAEQSAYDEALAAYNKKQQKEIDAMKAKADQMYVYDDTGKFIKTVGYEPGYGRGYDPNRAFREFESMIEASDTRQDRGENRGQYRYSDEAYQSALNRMKAFGTQEQYDKMIDLMKEQDREFEGIQMMEDFETSRGKYTQAMSDAAARVEAAKAAYGSESAEAQEAYETYANLFDSKRGMKKFSAQLQGYDPLGLGSGQMPNLQSANIGSGFSKGGFTGFTPRVMAMGGGPGLAAPFASAVQKQVGTRNSKARNSEAAKQRRAMMMQRYNPLASRSGLNFDLMDAGQIQSMNSEQLNDYVNNLMGLYA